MIYCKKLNIRAGKEYLAKTFQKRSSPWAEREEKVSLGRCVSAFEDGLIPRGVRRYRKDKEKTFFCVFLK